jgi:hypothetical protein
MGGDTNIYFSVYGLTNELPCLADGFENSADSVRDYVKWMKARVDEYHDDPTAFHADAEGGER